MIARSNAIRVVDLLGYQNLIVQSQLNTEMIVGQFMIDSFIKKSLLFQSQYGQSLTQHFGTWLLPVKGPLPQVMTRGSTRPPSASRPASTHLRSRPSPHTKKQPICLEWNDSPSPGCPHPGCHYNHTCYRCAHNPNEFNKNHKAIFCPNREKSHQ